MLSMLFCLFIINFGPGRSWVAWREVRFNGSELDSSYISIAIKEVVYSDNNEVVYSDNNEVVYIDNNRGSVY